MWSWASTEGGAVRVGEADRSVAPHCEDAQVRRADEALAKGSDSARTRIMSDRLDPQNLLWLPYRPNSFVRIPPSKTLKMTRMIESPLRRKKPGVSARDFRTMRAWCLNLARYAQTV